MKVFNGEHKIGILGGGQLGRMLIQEAINFNLSIYALDPDDEAPCKHLCDKFEQGDVTDYETVYHFGKQVHLLTIEIERVNVDALERLEKEGVLVYPQSRVIRLIQDKALQKQFFVDHAIPTAVFKIVSDKENLKQTTPIFPCIQKLRKDGYDGKGVVRLNSDADFSKAFDAPSIIEELVDFEKEISVIVARNSKGEVCVFPLVDMEFNTDVNLVEFLISPSSCNNKIEEEAQKIAIKIIEELSMVGLLAVEMFLTKDGRVLVNEVAPRPHNSGHQSIEGNYTSQFEQHLRAILNMPLGDTSCIANAVMINLLGQEGYEGLAIYEGFEEALKVKGVYPHLYGKTTTKPFRKMGHVTILDENREEAIRKARLVQSLIKVKA